MNACSLGDQLVHVWTMIESRIDNEKLDLEMQDPPLKDVPLYYKRLSKEELAKNFPPDLM